MSEQGSENVASDAPDDDWAAAMAEQSNAESQTATAQAGKNPEYEKAEFDDLASQKVPGYPGRPTSM